MSPVHVRAEPGDFAESVLLPGDPLRAKYIAENFFEDAKLVTEERGILGYTGTYKGEPVSVQATGLGRLYSSGRRTCAGSGPAVGIARSCGWGISSSRPRRRRTMARSPRSPAASPTPRRHTSTSCTRPTTPAR